jgi:hypothetical protein
MYPSLILKDQFGEQSNNLILGGSSQLSCNFIVDHANGNGLGIRSLKSPGGLIKSVYMNTSQTPAAGNPNPVAGLILVNFSLPYSSYVNGAYGFGSPVSGTPINVTSGLSVGKAYTIVSLGTTSLSAWQALGWLYTVAPTVGATFIAITASAGTGTGTVEVPLATGSGVDQLELVGDPNQTCNQIGGGSLICATFGPTNSSTTTKVLTAIADNTVVGLTFNMIPVPGELI